MKITINIINSLNSLDSANNIYTVKYSEESDPIVIPDDEIVLDNGEYVWNEDALIEK